MTFTIDTEKRIDEHNPTTPPGIPKNVTIVLSLREVGYLMEVLDPGVNVVDREGVISDIYAKIWSQFADQVVRIAQPELYQMIIKQRGMKS